MRFTVAVSLLVICLIGLGWLVFTNSDLDNKEEEPEQLGQLTRLETNALLSYQEIIDDPPTRKKDIEDQCLEILKTQRKMATPAKSTRTLVDYCNFNLESVRRLDNASQRCSHKSEGSQSGRCIRREIKKGQRKLTQAQTYLYSYSEEIEDLICQAAAKDLNLHLADSLATLADLAKAEPNLPRLEGLTKTAAERVLHSGPQFSAEPELLLVNCQGQT
jgi:hypothetical protein